MTPKEEKTHICPVWIGHILAHPLRKWMHHPEKILSKYIAPDMTVIDAGCALGYFSFPMARMTGRNGRVICIDVQQKMLDKLVRRAARKGLGQYIDTHLSGSDSLNIGQYTGKVDFVLAFAVVHETGYAVKFIQELAGTLKPGGKFLVAEPSGHVKEELFQETLDAGKSAGLKGIDRPKIKGSLSVLWEKV